MEDNPTSPVTNNLRKIVLNNLNNEQFGVEDLADIYGLSRSQLHKKLKKQTGKSISQFIREVRLEEAKKLLEQEDVTASEAAYQVGFSSATYFNTRFKDYFGYPPGEVKVRASYEKESQENTSNDILPLKSSQKNNWQKWSIVLFGLALLVMAGFFFLKKTGNPEQSSEALDKSLPLADSISNEKTIAVLPLKNWSGDPDLEYICDGMTDAIINRLANIQSIDKVTPYTSVVKYKNATTAINEVAAELGVSSIIQGSFQLSGNQVGVKLQMIDGKSERQFWSQEYSAIWESSELFGLQAKVTENIVRSVGAQLTDTEINALNLIPTHSKDAYNLFLQANYEWSKATKLGSDNAKQLYEEAIAADSTFVEAYVRLSILWKKGAGVWGHYDPEEARLKSKAYMLTAKRLAPDNQEVVDFLLMTALFDDWDFATLEEQYEKTLIAPLYLMYTGKYEEALEYMRQAEGLKKANRSQYSHWYAEALFYNGKKTEVLELYKNDFALLNDDYNWLRESAKYLYYLGEYQMARDRLDRLMRIIPDRPPIVIWLDLVLSEVSGREKELDKKLKLLLQADKTTSSGSPAWFIALFYSHLKDYEAAFVWLTKSYEKGEGELIWLHSEPLLRPVRGDKRYLEMHKKIGFPSPPLEPVAFP